MVINIMLMEVTSGRENVRNVRAADHNISGRKWGMGSIEEEENRMFAELRLEKAGAFGNLCGMVVDHEHGITLPDGQRLF